MATQTQTGANRRNSEKSTGSTSAAGKAASVIVRGKTADSLDTLAAQYQDDYQPQTAGELLRRLLKTEAHLWQRQFARLDRRHDLDESTFLGDAYDYCGMTFSRSQRCYDSVSREFHRTLNDLMRVQAARRKATSPVESQPELDLPPAAPPQPTDSKPIANEIGFVPSTDPHPAPASAPVSHPDPARAPQPPADQPLAPKIGFVPSTGPEAAPPIGAAHEPDPIPAPQPPADQPLAPKIGFVPSTDPHPAPAGSRLPPPRALPPRAARARRTRGSDAGGSRSHPRIHR